MAYIWQPVSLIYKWNLGSFNYNEDLARLLQYHYDIKMIKDKK